MSDLDLEALTRIVVEDAAIRRIQRLQPIGGAGDKIMPAIYSDRKHAFEHRRIDGEVVPCVLMDSVPSQAKRLSLALLAALRRGEIAIPYLAVDFAEFAAVVADGEVTSLTAPHRLYDAIMRDSEMLNGMPFTETTLFQRLADASPLDTTALFEASPTSLLFGAWNSTGERGGAEGKFARCLVSEIIGIGVAADRHGNPDGVATESRIDPLNIRRNVPIIARPGDWVVAPKGQRANASAADINHGNITPGTTPRGVSVDHCRHIAVISCAALRRYRLPGYPEPVAHALLAALGLFALARQDRDGYCLRSRCDLVPEGHAPIEIVHRDGSVQEISVGREDVDRLARAAIAAAGDAGLPWGESPLRLRPQPKLAELVRQSRGLADGDDAA